jgi:hypothetical protein
MRISLPSERGHYGRFGLYLLDPDLRRLSAYILPHGDAGAAKASRSACALYSGQTLEDRSTIRRHGVGSGLSE